MPNPNKPERISPAPARRSPKRRAPQNEQAAPAPLDVGGVSGTEPASIADDRRYGNESDPTPDEIAEAAYHRYLRRGADHGRDFDDWIEAEQELRSRRK